MNTIITETTEYGEVPVDIYQKLAGDRILFVNNEINDKLASDFCATLLLKDNEGSEKITVFLNSDGGDIRSTFMIYDVMKMVECPLEIICTGFALDEASLLLVAGTPGLRFATRNSVISVGPLSNISPSHGDMTNAKNHLDQSIRDNNRMMEVIAKHTKKPLPQTLKDYNERVFMTPASAVKRGIIDHVVADRKKDS